jgi:hypothetical protein
VEEGRCQSGRSLAWTPARLAKEGSISLFASPRLTALALIAEV